MTNESTDPSIQTLLDFARGLHPQMEIAPCDLQPSGRYALPPGFELHIDVSHDEWVRLFGPNETSTRVKTLIQYGGRVLIRGIDVLRALAVLTRVGEPVWERSLDAQAEYWRALLAEAAPFVVPDKAPMTRADMEAFIDRDPSCQRVISAFIEAVNTTGRLVSNADMQDFILKASADPEAAVLYYQQLRDRRKGLSSPQPARRKRTVQPAVTQEA